MKLTVNLKKKNVLFIGYIIITLMIWFFLSNLPSEKLSLFTHPINRLLFIVALSAIIWFIYEQITSAISRNKYKDFHPELFNRFNSIILLLKKLKTEKKASPLYADVIDKKIRLYDLPWILTIGPAKTGKTTLLAQSGLSFLLTKKIHQTSKKITSTQYYDWWATREAVIIDMAGSHVFSEDSESNDLNVWDEFLRLLQIKRRPAFNSIVFYLSIKQLSSLSQVEQNQLFSTFKKRLIEIQHILSKPIPFYIIFTQTDCLNGFYEYFRQTNTEQLEKPWGIQFAKKHISCRQKLLESFDAEFETMLLHLHDQIIEKLHHEPNHDIRCLIEEFPLQLETFKKPIARLLQYLGNLTTGEESTRIQGIFFTACGQKKVAIDRLLTPMSNSFELALLQRQQLQSEHATYFVKGLYNEVIFPQIWKNYLLPGTPYISANTRNILSTSTAVGLIIACTFIWSHEFSSNIQSLSKVEQTISNYYLNQHASLSSDLNSSVQALSSLKQAQDFLQHEKFPWLLKQKFFIKKDNLQQLVKETYQKAIVIFLHQQITESLLTEINKKATTNSEHLYETLKIYLSFNQRKRLNINSLTTWLQKYNKNENKTIQQLKEHLQLLETQNYPAVDINPSLIYAARNALSNIPKAELAIIILKNELTTANPDQVFSLANINKTVATVKDPTASIVIPSIYTHDSFLHAYEKMIPMAVSITMQGNWVTGEYQSNNMSYQELIKQTNDLYFSEYIKMWEDVLNQLQIESFSSFKHAIQVLDNIAKPDSSLQKLLKTIYYQTNVTYNSINTPISIKFQSLQKLFEQTQEKSITAVNTNLLKLQDLLAHITNTPNNQAAAYQIARQRMQDSKQYDIFDIIETQAITMPEPLRSWLMQINQNSWKLILSNAKIHVHQAWQQKVLPYYITRIKDRYPLEPTAKSEIRPNDFAEFFGPAGKIDSFYLSYLAPFIDKSQQGLHWHRRNGEHLPVSDNFLNQIARSINIKNVFFPNDPRSLQIQFAINPLVLQPMVKSLQFDLDNQHITFSKNSNTAISLNWPGKQPLHIASITLTNMDGKQLKKTETGTWSWFKLLGLANLEEKEGNNIIATFDLDGYGAKCEIESDYAINPFSLALLPNLKLTEIS